MLDFRTQKGVSHRFKNTLIAWMLCFAIGTSWESAYRILVEFTSWGCDQAISFMVNNLAIAILCSILLAFFHLGLFVAGGWIDNKDSFTNKLLRPEFGLATATLVGLSLWVLRYRFPLKQNLFVFSILILAYVGCMMIARFLHRHVLFRFSPSRIVQISVLAVLIPILIAAITQWIRNSALQVGKPPDLSVQRIVLISVDTLRCDYISAYGSPYIRTPVIDQIAAEGALFENATSLMPETGPSHMSMLTGLSPLHHGVLGNGHALPKGVPTLAMYLRESGFRTGGFVSGAPLQVGSSRLDRGFQSYDDNFSWIDPFDGSFCGRFVSDLPFLSKDLARDAQFTTDSALKWLKKNVDSHFFLFLHYYDPHFPYGGHIKSHQTDRAAPEDLPHQKKLYGAEVKTVDTQISRIIAFLKESGVYDQSLLIFTSDHGENLGEHGHFYGHSSLYEPVLRVPMILRWPGKITPGTVMTQQVALTDIFRTILEATKLESKQAPNSINLVGLANRDFDSPHRLVVSNLFVKNVKHSVRTNEWKLIRNDDRQRSYELYHLLSDPNESVNAYSRKTEMARQLEAILNHELQNQVHTEMNELSPAQIENLKALGYIN